MEFLNLIQGSTAKAFITDEGQWDGKIKNTERNPMGRQVKSAGVGKMNSKVPSWGD